jgi:pentatricopeptide repeat domain-containing protein 1
MSFDANNILKELVSSSQALPTFDVFEVLWATRNVCVPGFGVFDAKLEKRKIIMNEMKECDIGVNPVIYTTLMDAYFKAGNRMEAINLLEKMRDLVLRLQL